MRVQTYFDPLLMRRRLTRRGGGGQGGLDMLACTRFAPPTHRGVTEIYEDREEYLPAVDAKQKEPDYRLWLLLIRCMPPSRSPRSPRRHVCR